MKQLSALGVRRQFYRNPRRLRALRPGEELDTADLLGQHGFNYFVGQFTAEAKLVLNMGATTGGQGVRTPQIWTNPQLFTYLYEQCDYVTDCTKLGRPVYFFL